MRSASEAPLAMPTAEEDRCSRCRRVQPRRLLQRCPTCYRLFCQRCGVRQQGKPFCSKGCAEYFLFGDEDEPES